MREGFPGIVESRLYHLRGTCSIIASCSGAYLPYVFTRSREANHGTLDPMKFTSQGNLGSEGDDGKMSPGPAIFPR